MKIFSTHRQLRHAIVLGLSLATAALAQGAARRAPLPASPAQKAAPPRKGSPTGAELTTPDSLLLGSHHAQVTKRIDPEAAPFVELMPESGDEVVAVNEHGVVMWSVGAKAIVARRTQVSRFGLDDEARYRAALAHALVRSAKVQGNPNDPAVVKQARAILTRELETAAALSSWLEHPGQSATVHQLLVDHAKLTANPNELFAPSRVAIGQIPGETLQLVGEFGRQKVNQGELRPFKVEVVILAGVCSNATLADLHRFGIRDQAALDARLSEAIAKGPSPAHFAARADRVRMLTLRADDDADLALLDRYRKSAGMSKLRITGDDTNAIELGATSKLYLMHDAKHQFDRGKSGWPQVGWPRDLNLMDFDRQRIKSPADLKARFAEVILQQAGLSGPASDGVLVAKARVKLAARIDEIDRFVKQVHRAADFDLLTRYHEQATRAKRSEAGTATAKPVAPLFLAEDAELALLWHDGALRAASRWDARDLQMQRQEGNTLSWVRLKVVDGQVKAVLKPHFIAPVSFEQLSRFGMHNLEEFDAHLARRMLDAAGLPASFSASLPAARQILQQQLDDG